MILVLNCGSQSIKWKVFDKKLRPVKQNKLEAFDTKNYEAILSEEINKLKDLEIDKIGHRVVHGGGKFTKATQITGAVLNNLGKISYMAPSHDPYNIMGIKACRKVFKRAKDFAVFDTEFFAGLPEIARKYALPENISKRFGFRRFGFHGISHEYAAKKACESTGMKFKRAKIITCHLGGGSSIAAIKNGKAIDTSMGFTPLEGLVMMTRSGSIDPGIVLELAKKYGHDRAGAILNKESGIKGLCGESEMFTVLEKMRKRDKKAKLAFDIFIYSIKKYIGAYSAVLGGCDLLVFTGSIGAGKPATRNDVIKNMNILKNTKVLAIETDEELAIAQKICKIKTALQ